MLALMGSAMKELTSSSVVCVFAYLLTISGCAKRGEESHPEPNTLAPVQGAVQSDVEGIAVNDSLENAPDNDKAAVKHPEGRIPLRILYAGMTNTRRQEDFVSFLSSHFVEVKAVAFSSFTREQAHESDVVILDKDGIQWADRGGNPLSDIQLSETYSRATLALGAPGAFLYSKIRLKPGYR